MGRPTQFTFTNTIYLHKYKRNLYAVTVNLIAEVQRIPKATRMNTNNIAGSLDEDVYLGFWINRAFDSVQGATLTLSHRQGGFLIAFLAIFVATSGRSLWKILRCVLHFVYSSEGATEGVHLQRQAILRNTSMPLDAALELTLVFTAWRRRGTGLIRKLLVPTTVALVLVASFFIAGRYQHLPQKTNPCCYMLTQPPGTFSSKVSSSSANEILIIGRDCDVDLHNKDSMDLDQYSTLFLNRKAAEHLAYASQCYQVDDSTRPNNCKIMTIPALPVKVDHNASCPFDNKICKQPSGNMFMETEVLDNYEHFGLNAGPHFSIQVTEHCAPIVTAGYSTSSVDPDRNYVNFTSYHYGGGHFDAFTFEVANNSTSHTSEGTGNYDI